MKGYMYILQCADGSYYTGSTTNLELRLKQHQNGEGTVNYDTMITEKLIFPVGNRDISLTDFSPSQTFHYKDKKEAKEDLKKWFSRIAVCDILIKTMESLNLTYPEVGTEQRKEIGKAKTMLLE